jgi:hypothetical protein
MAHEEILISRGAFEYLLDREEQLFSRINHTLKLIDAMHKSGELNRDAYERLERAVLGTQ